MKKLQILATSIIITLGVATIIYFAIDYKKSTVTPQSPSTAVIWMNEANRAYTPKDQKFQETYFNVSGHLLELGFLVQPNSQGLVVFREVPIKPSSLIPSIADSPKENPSTKEKSK